MSLWLLRRWLVPLHLRHRRRRTLPRAQRIMRDRAGKLNAHLSSKETEKFCKLTTKDQQRLDEAMNKLGMSARDYYKVLKVARTIADLSGTTNIETPHLNEAIGYRQLDRYRTAC